MPHVSVAGLQGACTQQRGRSAYTQRTAGAPETQETQGRITSLLSQHPICHCVGMHATRSPGIRQQTGLLPGRSLCRKGNHNQDHCSWCRISEDQGGGGHTSIRICRLRWSGWQRGPAYASARQDSARYVKLAASAMQDHRVPFNPLSPAPCKWAELPGSRSLALQLGKGNRWKCGRMWRPQHREPAGR